MVASVLYMQHEESDMQKAKIFSPILSGPLTHPALLDDEDDEVDTPLTGWYNGGIQHSAQTAFVFL